MLSQLLFSAATIYTFAWTLAVVATQRPDGHPDLSPIYVLIGAATLLQLSIALFAGGKRASAGANNRYDGLRSPVGNARRTIIYDERGEPILTEWKVLPAAKPVEIPEIRRSDIYGLKEDRSAA